MSYPTIFRKRTIEYRQSGHTLKEISKAFKVLISAIEEWEKKLKERGNLENKALNRPHKIVHIKRSIQRSYAPMLKNIQMHIKEKWKRSLTAQLQRYKKH